VKIDLNCDVGEGCQNDAGVMDYVSSVNIACGLHAGDAATMRKTVETAVEKRVSIGAHPGYPDRDNFGRIRMNLSNDEVYDIVSGQIADLQDICLEAGGKLHHVKPHGALYNQAAADAVLAQTIARAARDVDSGLLLFGLSGSHSITEAQKCGLRTASEVFADRTYRSDGSLSPRTESNALIDETDRAVAQVLQMIKCQTVTTTDGRLIPIIAETVCIHGDGANAVIFAEAIRRKLTENGIEIGPL